MNKLFCVSCGFKILYEVTKPKFCSSCGESVTSISSGKTKEEKDDSSVDINIEKLKQDVVIEKSTGGLDVKNLWANASGPSNVEPRSESPDPQGKDLLDKTIQDCSSSRMRDINE
jgi:hypothetical protein|tara:strand:+ start:844 stop:1188 length:345 start_codon:yes stop_codon:yes gene_type:complete